MPTVTSNRLYGYNSRVTINGITGSFMMQPGDVVSGKYVDAVTMVSDGYSWTCTGTMRWISKWRRKPTCEWFDDE